MQIDLLDTFLDLLETRSFHRTAERLGVSQSTVSGRVRALEEALGVRVFDRSRAGVQLTTEGLRFEPHARALRLLRARQVRPQRPRERQQQDECHDARDDRRSLAHAPKVLAPGQRWNSYTAPTPSSRVRSSSASRDSRSSAGSARSAGASSSR